MIFVADIEREVVTETEEEGVNDTLLLGVTDVAREADLERD